MISNWSAWSPEPRCGKVENAPDLIADMCEVVGYYDWPEDEK